MKNELVNIFNNWSSEELNNLATLLELDKSCNIEQIIDQLKWLYHSKTRASTEALTRNTIGKLRSVFDDKEHRPTRSEDLRKIPTYDE